MTLKNQTLLRIARNQCPEHNGETFCIKQGYAAHSGSHVFLPAGERFTAAWREVDGWRSESRLPEEVVHAESVRS